MNKKKYKFDTNTIHGGQLPDPATLSRAVPIYQTSSYLFKNTEHAARLFSLEEEGYIYTRIMNPTTEVFEKRMSLLENGIGALAVSSGQAAETLSILNIAGCGDEIISSSSLYGGTFNLFAYTFSKIGIKVNFVDPLNPDNFKKAITNKTKAIFAESVGNPKLDTLDFEEVSKIAHSHQIPLIIDSTFPTPYLINPIKWGADIVVHSATKFIGGHGTSIGGVIIDSGNFDWSCSDKFKELNTPDPSYHGIIYTKAFGKAAYIVKARVQLLRDLGPALSPFNAFLFLQGLETLPLRMKKHCENALSVAEYLESNSNVTWVKYPGLKSHPSYHLAKKYHKNGFGAIIGFGIKGGLKSGQKFIENLKLFSHLANVGDAKSLAIHPATTTHQQLSRKQREAAGVTDDFIRLSIGLEDKDDLIDDLKQALEGT